MNEEEMSKPLDNLSGAAVRGEAVALTDEEIDIVWQSMPGGPSHWLKGFGYQNFARAIECEYQLKLNRAADAPSEPSEPEKLDTNQSREYLVKFMEQHFTDKTYHRYIRGEYTKQNSLAGDFAWQMARALRRIEAGVLKSRAADAPSEPKGLTFDQWMDRVDENGWTEREAPCGDLRDMLRGWNAAMKFGKSRAADALDSQPTDSAVQIADKERVRIAEKYQQSLDDGTCEVGGHVNRQWAHLEGAVMVVQALKRSVVSKPTESLRFALQTIHDTFKADLDQGFKTRDKEFAVEIAANGLSESDDLLSVMDHPKAVLKREDWDPATRKPKVKPAASQPAASAIQKSIGDDARFCDLMAEVTCALEEQSSTRTVAWAALTSYLDGKIRAPAAQAASDIRNAALELAASTIELFDDATMKADYMLDSTECAGIIRALKQYQQEGSEAGNG